MSKSIEINVVKLLTIKSTLIRLKLLDEFQFKFIKSMTQPQYIQYSKKSFYNGWDYYGRREVIYISEKQYKVFSWIEAKYNELSIYERYLDYFYYARLTLSDFDKGYFETYVDDYIETEYFKKWLSGLN